MKLAFDFFFFQTRQHHVKPDYQENSAANRKNNSARRVNCARMMVKPNRIPKDLEQLDNYNPKNYQTPPEDPTLLTSKHKKNHHQ